MFHIFINLKTLLTSFVFPCCLLVLSRDFYDLKACPFVLCGAPPTVTTSPRQSWDSGAGYGRLQSVRDGLLYFVLKVLVGF